MQPSRSPQPRGTPANKKCSASELESSASPACHNTTNTTTTREPASHKRIKLLEAELIDLRKDLASGWTIRRALSQTLAKKSGVVVELREMNRTQEKELEKRHERVMELHDENGGLVSKAREVEVPHKEQLRESEKERKGLEEKVKRARKEINLIKARKVKDRTGEVAALHKKIEILEHAASKHAKELQASKNTATLAQEAASENSRALQASQKTASNKLLADAKGFSMRLQKRDDVIELLKEELKKHGLEIPELGVRMGKPK